MTTLVLAATIAASPNAVLAQSAGGSIGDAFEALHLRATPPPAADFVTKSRPDPESLDYQPLSATAKPSPQRRTAEQLNALGAELELARERNAKAAARVKIPDPPARSRHD